MKPLKNLRKYGKPPFRLAVVHGGPGAAGQMAPMARVLSDKWGVLEPLQTEFTISGQVEELKRILEKNAELPVILAGFSWGAWLIYIFAAAYPDSVSKLILIGSGPFEESDAENILEARFKRLSRIEKQEARSLLDRLENPFERNKNALLSRLGFFIARADAFNPMTRETGDMEVNFDIHQRVWREAAEMRGSGKLLKLGESIRCPVVAIHGDYDPHPYAGVEGPLSKIIKNFRFILLKNCGHMPWIEIQASEDFYRILKEEINA